MTTDLHFLCRNWGLEMLIPSPQSQSQELAKPGFELSSVWLWHQLCQMYSSHYFKVTIDVGEVCCDYGVCSTSGWGQGQRKQCTTQPLQVYICCLPASEIFPFFTCHNPTCCVGPRFSDTSSWKPSQKHCMSGLVIPSFCFLAPNHNTSHPTF